MAWFGHSREPVRTINYVCIVALWQHRQHNTKVRPCTTVSWVVLRTPVHGQRLLKRTRAYQGLLQPSMYVHSTTCVEIGAEPTDHGRVQQGAAQSFPAERGFWHWQAAAGFGSARKTKQNFNMAIFFENF